MKFFLIGNLVSVVTIFFCLFITGIFFSILQNIENTYRDSQEAIHLENKLNSLKEWEKYYTDKSSIEVYDFKLLEEKEACENKFSSFCI